VLSIAERTAILAGLYLLRARTPGTPPGDHDEAHANNTFQLPEGAPLRKKIKAFGRRQLKKMLGTLPAIGEPLPPQIPAMTPWDAPMTAAFVPLISAYWDEAGKVTRERLGLDPDAWEVHDPHLHEMVQKQTFSFCEETNKTTHYELGEALQKLRDEFDQGLHEGDPIRELRKRVQGVFQNLDDYRANMIARTEASRAVHRASAQSAAESGVVKAKKWLAAANSCDKCREYEAKTAAHPIPLTQEFDVVGSHPEYASIKDPPGHPHCRCSIAYVLIDEYARELQEDGTPEGYQPGSLGPDPETSPKKEQPDLSVKKPSYEDGIPSFTPSKATVAKMTRQERTALAHATVTTFGEKRTLKQLAAMTGAPDDATVTFSTLAGQIEYHASGPSLKSMSGTLMKSAGDGKVVNRIGWVNASGPSQRTGTSIHGRMVEHGAMHGIDRLSLDAAQGANLVGHRVWPILCYDGPLRSDTLAELPDSLKGAKTIRQLMLTEGGWDWWLANPRNMDMSFDLKVGSKNRIAWAGYWKNLSETEKAKVKGKRKAPTDSTQNEKYPNTLGLTDADVEHGLHVLRRQCVEDGTLDEVNTQRAVMGLPPWKIDA
jgi:hypothetical protein